MAKPLVLKGSHTPSPHPVIGRAPATGVMTLTLLLRRKAALKPPGKSGRFVRMTREAFARAHGLRDDDLAAVRRFAIAHGLTVGEVQPAARSVRITGTVQQLEKAFGVTIQRHQTEDGLVYRSHDTDVTLPAELSSAVEHVLGLSERPIARPHLRRAKDAAGSSFAPNQLASIYQFPAGSGAGQCIGIVELGGGYQTSDLQTFFSGLGLQTPAVTAVGVDGGSNVPGGDPNGADGEVELDIEVAGAVAPGASFAVYFAPNTDAGFLDAVNSAIHDTSNHPDVISISWGGPESSWTSSSMSSFDEAFQSAATLGISVCVAAGDNGSSDGTSGNMVDFPASSPNVLACGGTSLQASGSTITSETVWNDGGGEATGGGMSTQFPVPAYQSGLSAALTAGGTTPLTGRGVPDVAGNADPQTGYQIVVDGQSTVVGGTSAVAPLWAGLVARINALASKNQGLFNSALSDSVANDITVGNNGAYSAAVGWDACTGWGSPIGTALLSALGAVAPGSGASGGAGGRKHPPKRGKKPVAKKSAPGKRRSAPAKTAQASARSAKAAKKRARGAATRKAAGRR